ncbi:unnamed protein product [Penicillium pancosmium]
MAQNQERIDPATRARHICEAKIHLDRIYFSDTFVELLREGLEDGTGLAQYIIEHQRLCFNDEKWRSLFQKALRGELELQELKEGILESPAADNEAFNSFLQKVWEDYFPKESRDNLESRKPGAEVPAGAQLLAPVILSDDRGKAFLELLKKKNDQTELVYSEYEPDFAEVIRQLIDDPLFTKRNDELSPEDFAKMVRRDAFHTIQACLFNFAEYNVGGPDLNAVKFEFDEMRALVSFQCRLGNL